MQGFSSPQHSTSKVRAEKTQARERKAAWLRPNEHKVAPLAAAKAQTFNILLEVPKNSSERKAAVAHHYSSFIHIAKAEITKPLVAKEKKRVLLSSQKRSQMTIPRQHGEPEVRALKELALPIACSIEMTSELRSRSS